MSSLPAGWYKDPADPATQRYWDGEGWIGKAIGADAVPPDGPPPVEEEPPPAPATAPAPTTTPAPVAPPAAPAPPPGWGPMPPPPPGWQPPQQDGPMPGMPGGPQPGWNYTPYPVQPRPHGFALAGLGPRLVARLLDILAVLVLNVVVNGYFAYQFWQEFLPTYRASMDAVANGQSAFDVQPASGRTDALLWVMLIVATLLWLLYEAPATASSGQTLGKRLMRIRVVAVENTEPLGFGRAFGRWARLGLWTPAWGCAGFGLVMQFIDSISPLFDQQLRQAFHDKTARTVVVALPPHDQLPATRKDNTDDSAHSR
ncbi:hypothetical protein GCM10010172_27800 [Paractinoplanes ferrugineus]|uniref:RDD family protein n=1 Tax=Paractinoplanes ferrugineus TaxID=113564 RepID=A0A919MDA6_9ACTN|nr:RDD family protein [Actinoplanes ferrugineus]GIE08310.1 hypothetical protein Afe05nite_01500 [Actinoplanes ferrugineus]